jgi:hypothetical protein
VADDRRDAGRFVAPSADVMAFFAGDNEVLDVDVEGHVRWLETGEGDPWPAKHG